jgi:hypothetical protein
MTPLILQDEETRLLEWQRGLRVIAGDDPDARAVLKRVDRSLDVVRQMRQLYADLRREQRDYGRAPI